MPSEFCMMENWIIRKSLSIEEDLHSDFMMNVFELSGIRNLMLCCKLSGANMDISCGDLDDLLREIGFVEEKCYYDEWVKHFLGLLRAMAVKARNANQPIHVWTDQTWRTLQFTSSLEDNTPPIFLHLGRDGHPSLLGDLLRVGRLQLLLQFWDYYRDGIVAPYELDSMVSQINQVIQSGPNEKLMSFLIDFRELVKTAMEMKYYIKFFGD
jgi:hypothetical protein